MKGVEAHRPGGSNMSISTPALVGGAALAAVVVGAAGFAIGGGWSHEGALEATRLTARFAFPWFVAAWSASALASLWPGGWRSTLLRRRRAVGLGFAACHFVHLGFILTLALVFHHVLPKVTIYAGGFTYLLIAAMAATSNDAAVRALGRKGWKALHVTGGLMILLVFTNSYVSRLAAKPWLAIPALSLIALAVTLKLAAWALRGRRLQAA
jgi:DMSO/TMAO reductase YedYZ heme-binding membrane subunit